MKNAVKLLGILPLVLLLSGCPIWIDSESVEVSGCGSTCCDGDCVDECRLDTECPPGYYCESGRCGATWYCDWDGSCPDGYVCDDRDTCIPEQPVPCDDNEDCVDGFCEIPDGADSGICERTWACDAETMCPPGYLCDDRGVCIPDEGPCPTGECGCVDDGECEGEQLCIASRCTDPATICIYDFECAGVCLNNECHATCTDTCPVGQGCDEGICADLTVGLDDCVYDEDCGDAHACINATCHATCEAATECGEGETCAANVCRADVSPLERECSETNTCTEGMSCVRGVCRMPCVAPINCADEGDMTECSEGFCRFLSEIEPTCVRATDCGDDGFCLDGKCL